jgi:hypothetical protein
MACRVSCKYCRSSADKLEREMEMVPTQIVWSDRETLLEVLAMIDSAHDTTKGLRQTDRQTDRQSNIQIGRVRVRVSGETNSPCGVAGSHNIYRKMITNKK